MKCLLRYKWVKLPRKHIPSGKGLLGFWAKLASRAAFRPGKVKYCGHINKVSAGSWAGGIVGIKSILGVRSRKQAMGILAELAELGYIDYHLDAQTKKLSFSICDWVVKCSGSECSSGTVYTTDGFGFLCMPRSITQRLVDAGYTFEESDALLDLWCHTVWQDSKNAFSYVAPCVQYGHYDVALTLETLGTRWKWEKTKVWRFFQKHEDAYALHKLPSSCGCLIFNKVYPGEREYTEPVRKEIMRILDEIRILGMNAYITGSEKDKLNWMIAQYSQSINVTDCAGNSTFFEEKRVADSPLNIRAYFSDCWNCISFFFCKEFERLEKTKINQIRGPCQRHRAAYL